MRFNLILIFLVLTFLAGCSNSGSETEASLGIEEISEEDLQEGDVEELEELLSEPVKNSMTKYEVSFGDFYSAQIMTTYILDEDTSLEVIEFENEGQQIIQKIYYFKGKSYSCQNPPGLTCYETVYSSESEEVEVSQANIDSAYNMFNSAKISEQYKKVVNGFESTCFTQKLEIFEETVSTESCVTDEHSVLSLMKSQNSDTGEELMTYTLLEYSEGTVEESMFELPQGYTIERLE